MNQSSDNIAVCCKCKERKAQVENRKEKVCNDCFLQQCLHRFKSTIRTKLKIWNDEKFLVCASGGANSMALIDMLHYSMDSNTHRKMFYKVLVLHIDEGIIYSHSKEQRLKTHNRLKSFINIQSSFDICILPLECLLSKEYATKLLKSQTSCLSEVTESIPELKKSTNEESLKEKISEQQSEDPQIKENPGEKEQIKLKDEVIILDDEKAAIMADFLAKFPTRGSSRQDLINLLKRKLMQWVARSLGIKKILLGNSGFSVASGIFGALCKGRGAHLPLEVGFSDEVRGEDVLTCLPLKDLLLKEITYYNYLRQVHVEQQITLAQQQNNLKLLPSHGSINQLCQNFLTELQDHSFMTVPTVLRTGARLALPAKPKVLCSLCRGLIDEAKNELETLSLAISSIKEIEQSEESKELINEKAKKQKQKLDPLCFGCEKLMKESKLPEEEVRSFLGKIWENF